MSTSTSYFQSAWSAWKRARAKTIPVEWLVACTATYFQNYGESDRRSRDKAGSE